MARLEVDVSGAIKDRFLKAMDVNRERARTTIELAERTAVRLDARFIAADDPKAQKLISKDVEGFYSALSAANKLLAGLEESAWEPDRLEQELRNLAESLEVGAGKVFQPIRVALTGTTVSEGVNVLLDVVGREESLRRIRKALEYRGD
jgi:glutamyl-tRNA synthetase